MVSSDINDNECKTSFSRPVVCKLQLEGNKTCQKASNADGKLDVNTCYTYQCNHWMKKNLKNRFVISDYDTNLNHPCYKCFTVGHNTRENYPTNSDYKIGYSNYRYDRGPDIGIKTVHTDDDGSQRTFNDMKKLYERLCIKSSDGTCNPDDTNIDSYEGYLNGTL